MAEEHADAAIISSDRAQFLASYSGVPPSNEASQWETLGVPLEEDPWRSGTLVSMPTRYFTQVE